MKRTILSILSLVLVGLILACSDKKNQDPEPIPETPDFRVPAEWEPHAATWIQWAGEYKASVLLSFANFIKIVQKYEPVHLIVYNQADKEDTQRFLYDNGVLEDNITWHIVTIDNSWMRDNGPIYITNGTKTWIQNWKFDGWGSGFGPAPYQNDNIIPNMVAGYLGIEVEDHTNYVLEKGNIEVNGAGVLAINWDCQDHRNPGMTKEQHEVILKNALGITKFLWAYGHYPEDGTIGHIDGAARFINENTIVVADFDSSIEDNFAQTCENEGLNVIRYPGSPNWLVGNGFVVAMGEDGNNDALKAQLQSFFPDRDVYMIDAVAIANEGGGIHCVTNDQPVLQ
jgi:agmatine deiminase